MSTRKLSEIAKFDYPTVNPSLNLDFANSKTLDPRIDFTRASAGVYYDGQTFAKAEENLLLYSEEFDEFNWLLDNTSLDPDSYTAPNNTNTARKLVENTDISDHGIIQTEVLSVVGKTYTYSVFVKPSERTFCQIFFGGFSYSGEYATFDLTNGTIGSASGNNINESIESYNNGWFRVSLTAQAVDNTGTTNIYFIMTDTPSATRSYGYAGDGNSGMFIWGAQFEERSQVTAYAPTTDQPVTRYQPVLQTATADRPRFDHDPLTGESKGLLIEEGRTNTVTYSEQLQDNSWQLTEAQVLDDVAIAPDGTVSADKLIETTTDSIHRIEQTTGLSATTYTTSVYLKAAERSLVNIQVENAGLRSVLFDVSQGLILNIGEEIDYASIEPVGNGWYKANVVNNLTFSIRFRISIVKDEVLSYQGDGFSGIYIWGAQQEEGSFPSSYIKTEGSQVTRSEDNVLLQGANFTDIYNPDEGTWYVHALQEAESSDVSYLLSLTGDAQNRLYMYIDRRINEYFTGFERDNVGRTIDRPSFVAGATDFRAAFSYQARGSAVLAVDGKGAVERTDSIAPIGIDTLQIGDRRFSSAFLNGHIKKLVYYDTQVSDNQLTQLTEK